MGVEVTAEHKTDESQLSWGLLTAEETETR